MTVFLNQLNKLISEGDQIESLSESIFQKNQHDNHTIIVLDDDPTGTQTIDDVPIITEWSVESIETLLQLKTNLFFILTNSRALQKEDAKSLAKEIGENIRLANQEIGRKISIISRSDSTLRGHYPNEVITLADGFLKHNAEAPSFITLLIPAFFQGGRFTLNNIHWVKQNNELIAANETDFAKDKTFGYQNADLKQWVIEKYEQEKLPYREEAIFCLSIQEIRSKTIDELSNILENNTATIFIINAVSQSDLQKIARAATLVSKPIIYRTAASFVNALSGIPTKPLLTKSDLEFKNANGGLTIIGSYVPKTTAQLEVLRTQYKADYIKLCVDEIFSNIVDLNSTITRIAKQISFSLKQGTNVVLYTSRELKSSTIKSKSLKIVNAVSETLVEIVQAVSVTPKFILTKGGITSSDIAVKSLEVKKAVVLGQIDAGIPVWKLEPTTKFGEIPYIVFPGNVGENDTLLTTLLSLE